MGGTTVRLESEHSRLLAENPSLQREVESVLARKTTLKQPEYPKCPVWDQNTPITKNLFQIQKFITSFEYNHTGVSFFQLRRDRGMKHLSNTAKTIIREALPIQCVEAVFIGVHLTNNFRGLVRLPLSFKSSVDGNEYQHIVLAIQHGQKWGTIGISRLKHKELKYDSLSLLVHEYSRSYADTMHELLNVYVGLPFTSDLCSEAILQWRILRLQVVNLPWDDVKRILEQYTKDCMLILEHFTREGEFPEFCTEDYRTGKISHGARKRARSFRR